MRGPGWRLGRGKHFQRGIRASGYLGAIGTAPAPHPPSPVLGSPNPFSFLLPPPVLQPAVEAFFLVHATERESKPPVRDTRESQLAHIKDEPPPLSPAPLTPATPSSLDPFFSREPSSMHISASLPPDTQKFLRFAGMGEMGGEGWGGGGGFGGLRGGLGVVGGDGCGAGRGIGGDLGGRAVLEGSF